MRTIAVIGLKGGSGKTTIAVHTALAAHLRGLKTLVADIDPQGSAREVLKARDGAAREEAERYLKASPFSLKRMKALVWHGLERDVSAHMAAHVEALSACFKSADHKEGVAAFLERRPAQFTGI